MEHVGRSMKPIKLEKVESYKLQSLVLKERIIQLEAEKNLNLIITKRIEFVKELAEKYQFDSKIELQLDESTNELKSVKTEE